LLPIVVEKEVIKEVPKVVVVEKEVVKEVVKEVPVVKEVITEVIKEVPVGKLVITEVIKEVPVIKEAPKDIVVEKILNDPAGKPIPTPVLIDKLHERCFPFKPGAFLSISPQSVLPGAPLKVTGTYFPWSSPVEQLFVEYDSTHNYSLLPPSQLVTDTRGNFSTTVVMPIPRYLGNQKIIAVVDGIRTIGTFDVETGEHDQSPIMRVSGYAKINNKSAPDNMVISAWYNGEQVARTVLCSGEFDFIVVKPRALGAEGADISFKIGNLPANETIKWEPNKTTLVWVLATRQ
jgi:hypothetical protein